MSVSLVKTPLVLPDFGRSTDDQRRAWQDLMWSERETYRAAFANAEELGHIAYQYAGGYYDHAKRTASPAQTDAMLQRLLTFSEDYRWAAYLYSTQRVGMRPSLAGAWEHTLRSCDLWSI